MKRYLGIFILTVMVGLSGCASDTDSDTQVSSRAYSMQIQQKSEPCSDIQWKKTDQVVRWIYVDTAGEGHIRIKMVIFWIRMAPRLVRPGQLKSRKMQ